MEPKQSNESRATPNNALLEDVANVLIQNGYPKNYVEEVLKAIRAYDENQATIEKRKKVIKDLKEALISEYIANSHYSGASNYDRDNAIEDIQEDYPEIPQEML